MLVDSPKVGHDPGLDPFPEAEYDLVKDGRGILIFLLVYLAGIEIFGDATVWNAAVDSFTHYR